MTDAPIHVRNLGVDVPYDEALSLQAELVRQRQADEIIDQLLILQHRPVITIPRDRAAENLLITEAEARRQGVQIRRTNRGGDITYHGPGQWVLYPIVKLQAEERDVRKYVRHLEQAMIDACAKYGLDAGRKEGLTGCWVGNEKIGAVGVRFSRWVACHGLAFNSTVRLDHFGLIVPCGIRNKGVCSLESLGRPTHGIADHLSAAVVHHLCRRPSPTAG